MATFERGARIRGGGQGEVFRGTADDGTPVAIKYLKPMMEVEGDGDELRRFEREITCQSSLEHVGIVEILAYDMTVSPPYFVMPLAEGSLRDLLLVVTDGLPEDQAIGIFVKILAAVSYAHAEGVLHRDLKPENILIIGGEPKLSDFGLGRRLYSGSTTLTVTNAALGTLQYSAPEQLRDAHTVDERADVFALGRILYEILTGEMAFFGVDLDKAPARYRHIILRATYAEPERRFASVGEMAREISLLSGSDEWLQPPSERSTQLISAISDGDSTKVGELARVLVENPEDAQLYLRVLAFAPAPVLAQLAVNAPEEYVHIMRVFDVHASGRHGFSFTDTLADFMVAVIDSTSNVEIRELLLARLLRLGTSHNRWYVADRFVDAAVELMQKDPLYAGVIAAILRDDPAGATFVRPMLSAKSLPPAVVEALAA